ncbi:MAG: hypothetical protein AAB213_04145 [Candidatus Omnitrophota bacterium]
MSIILRIIGIIMLMVGLIFGAIIFAGNLAEASGHFLTVLLFALGNIVIGVGLSLLKRLAIQSAIGFSILVVLVNFLTPYGWKQGQAFLYSILFYGVIAILSGVFLKTKKE